MSWQNRVLGRCWGVDKVGPGILHKKRLRRSRPNPAFLPISFLNVKYLLTGTLLSRPWRNVYRGYPHEWAFVGAWSDHCFHQ